MMQAELTSDDNTILTFKCLAYRHIEEQDELFWNESPDGTPYEPWHDCIDGQKGRTICISRKRTNKRLRFHRSYGGRDGYTYHDRIIRGEVAA